MDFAWDNTMVFENFAKQRQEELSQKPTRGRKVTITEITDNDLGFGDDPWTMDDNSSSSSSDEDTMIDAEEGFLLLDELVQEWKVRLESIVGDGLKKLRKNSKEKRLMAKYLPGKGERLAEEAKVNIFKVKILAEISASL